MKVFIAGPRTVNTLCDIVTDRMVGLSRNYATILVGDARGVDNLVQQCFADLNYKNVIVYASNGEARHNIGKWDVQIVTTGEKTKGFDFYACKDRKMAEDADYGFMIWNGNSKGTLNNMINLIKFDKEMLIYFIPHKKFYNINSMDRLHKLTSICGVETNRMLDRLLTRSSVTPYEQTAFDSWLSS